MEAKFLTGLFFTTFLLLLISQISASSEQQQQYYSYTNFIKTSCTSTTYPSVCLKTLLPYATEVKASQLKLTDAALSATLKSANATLSTISKLAKVNKITEAEAAVLKDCIENIKDSIGEIKESRKAISSIPNSADKSYLISNAQTWTSAAITDEDTCIDGFSDRKMISPEDKHKIRSSIVSLARVSSNALYLINHLQV